MFGLASAQAAATLAIVLEGFDLGLFNEDVLNGAILVILVTCLVSSFMVETSGRKLAILESNKKPTMLDLPDRILVPISKPEAIDQLMDLALLMQKPHSHFPVYALKVVKEDKDARQAVAESYKMLNKVIEHAVAADNEVKVISRVDVNVAGGIIRAMQELMITEVLIGWNTRTRASDMIFGSVLENLLKKTRQMIFVSRVQIPINTLQRIFVLLPPNAELETGFDRYVRNMV
ncbi:MAG: cation:proton antiporter, partial [Moraxellaceae bacterium]